MMIVSNLLLLKNKQLEQISDKVMRSMKTLLETRQGDTQSKMKNLINNNHYNMCRLFMQNKFYFTRSNIVTDTILYFRQCPLSLGIRKVFRTKRSNI